MSRKYWVAAVSGLTLWATPVFGQITVDGTAEGAYGTPIVVQGVSTNFGDSALGVVDFANGSELDAAYGIVDSGTLYLCLTGNLESNFNKLEIFIDSIPGGQNHLRGDNPDVDFNGLNRMGDDGSGNGLIFDVGVEPDFWIGVTGGGDPYTLYANYAELLTFGGGTACYLGHASAVSDGTLSDGACNPFNIRVTINNSNTGGVLGGCDTDDAGTVVTGVELAIPLGAIGNPNDNIKITAFINGSGHDVISNQWLGAAPPCELADYRDVRTVDLSTVAGNQYFEISNTGCCPADANCDGTVDFFDIDPLVAVILAGGGGCSPCAGDVNDDGTIDFFDIDAGVNAILAGACQ